jgi:hypothetical protein
MLRQTTEPNRSLTSRERKQPVADGRFMVILILKLRYVNLSPFVADETFMTKTMVESKYAVTGALEGTLHAG